MLRNIREKTLWLIEEDVCRSPKFEDMRNYISTKAYFHPIENLMISEGIEDPFMEIVNGLIKDGFVKYENGKVTSSTF